MAENRNLHVTLQVGADTKNAQNEFERLQQTLRDLSNKSISINTDSMQKASQAALELSGHLQKAFNVNTGTLDLNKFSASLKASGNDLTSYRQKLEAIGAEGQQAFLQVAQSIASADAPLIKANTKLTEFVGTLKNTARWQISSSILHGFMGSIQQAIGYAKDLNESLTSIQIVTNKSDEEMAKFAATANKAAQALSTTTTKYTDASLIYFQQGLNTEEVEKRTAVTVKMMHAAGTSAEEASSQLTAIWNNFYDGSKSLEYYADVITALGATTASSSEEISSGLQKFASIGETVGLSYEYAASAMATITAQSRESAETVGNALKSLFARIQSLKLGETLEDGVDLNKYAAAIEKVGVRVLDANGDLRDMDKILDDLMKRWKDLDRASQTALAQTVAGQRQYAQFMTLMNNSEAFQNNLNTAYDSSGTLAQQAQIWENSWQASSERVRAALESIYQDLINDDFFIGLNNGLATFIQGIDGVIKGVGGLKGILMMVGSIITQSLAKEAPNALAKLKEDFFILTGQAQQMADITRTQLLESLKQATSNKVGSQSESAEYQLQIEKIKEIAELKQDLARKEQDLTNAQKESYEQVIRQVEAEYDRQAALARTVDEYRQSVQASKNDAFDEALANTGDTSGLTQKLDLLEEYSRKLAQISTVQQATQREMASWKNDTPFPELKEQALKFIETLEKAELVDNHSDAWKNLKKEIEGCTTSATDLKAIMDKISQKDFTGIVDIDPTTLSTNLQNLINELTGDKYNIDKTVIDKIVGDSSNMQEAFQKLAALRDEIDKTRNKLPEIKLSIAQMFGKGVSTLMSFSAQLNSMRNAFRVFGDSGSDAITKVTSSIGLMITTANLAKNTFGMLKPILTGLGIGLGPVVGIVAGVTVAFTALSAILSKTSEDAKKAQEALEKAAESTRKIAEKTQEKFDEFKDEQTSNEDLLQSYQDLLDKYKETGEGKEALADAALAVVKAYDIENGAIDVALGNYDLLIDKAQEATKAETEHWQALAKTNYRDQRLAFGAEYLAFDDDDKYSVEQGRGYLSSVDNEIKEVIKNINEYSRSAIEEKIEQWRYAGDVSASVYFEAFEDAFKNHPEEVDGIFDVGLLSFRDEALKTFAEIGEGSRIMFSDGSDNNWDDNQFIKNAMDELEFLNYEIDTTMEKGGLTLNFDTSGPDAAIEAYEQVDAIVNKLKDDAQAGKIDEGSLLKSELYQNLSTYLIENADAYEKYIAARQELVSSTLADFDKDFEDTEENKTEAIEQATEALVKEGLAYDYAKEQAEKYFNTKYQTGSEKITTETTRAGRQMSEEELNDLDSFWEKNVSEKTREFFADKTLDLDIVAEARLKSDPNAFGKELDAQVELWEEQIKNSDTQDEISSQLNAVLNSSFKRGMNFKELEKFKTNSGIDWGQLIDVEGAEVQIIEWNDFLKMTESEQEAYLESLGIQLQDASIKNLEITKQNLEKQREIAEAGIEPARQAYEAAEDLVEYYKNTGYINNDAYTQAVENAEAARDVYEQAILKEANLADQIAANDAAIEEQGLNAQEQLTRALEGLDKTTFKENDTISAANVNYLKQYFGIDLNEFGIQLDNGRYLITRDADELNKEIHKKAQELREGLTQLTFEDFRVDQGSFSQTLQKQLTELESVGIDTSGFSNIGDMVDETTGKLNTNSKAYQAYCAAIAEYNGLLNTGLIENIHNFEDLKNAEDQLDSETFEALRALFEETGSWTADVKSLEDFMAKLDSGELTNVYEDYNKIKNVVTELSATNFMTLYEGAKETGDEVNFVKENTGKLKLTLDDLNNTELRGALGEEAWEKAVEGIDTTEMSISDLRGHIDDSGMTAEAYEKLLEEILGHEETTTKESIAAINEALFKGKIDAEEYLKLTKELLTSEQQLEYISSAKDKDGNRIEADERRKIGSTLSRDSGLSDSNRLEALKEEGQAMADLLKAGEATDVMWKQFGEDATALFKDVGGAADQAFSIIIDAFGPYGKVNPEGLGKALSSVFDSLDGSEQEKFETLDKILQQFGYTLDEVGIKTVDLVNWNTDDLWDFQKVDAYKQHFEDLVEAYGYGSEQIKEFANDWLSFIESADNMTAQDKINALSEAFANGAISAPQYLEAIQKVIEASNDLGLTTDELKSMALDFTISFYDQQGILEDMAVSIGKNVESMQELQHAEEELSSRGIDTYEMKKSALIALGEQYDELTDKVEAYKHSLYNENEQVRETAENDLALAVQCKELCDQYDIEYDLVHQLAESYQELGRQGDEFYRACANNTEIAADMAARYIRVNDGIKELEENWEEYEDVIKRMSAVYKQSGNSVESLNSFLYDNSKAVEGIRSAIAKTLAVKNKDIISNKMLAENADLVTEACHGNIKAILELQKVMAKNLSAKLGIDDKEFWATLDGTKETFLDWINNLPEGQLSIDNTLALQKLADMMYEAGMTVDQIEDYFRGMGIEVDFADDFIDETERLKDTISSAIGAIEEQGTELNNITAEQVETYLQQRELAEGINRDMIQESLDQARNAENEKNNIRSEGANENIRITQEEQNEKNNIEAEGENEEENIVVEGVNRIVNWVADKAQKIVNIYQQQKESVVTTTAEQSNAEAENSSKMEPEQMELTDQSEGSYQFAEAHTEDVPFSVTVPAFEASPGYMGFPTFSIHAVHLGGLSYKSIVGKPSNPVKTQDSKTTKMTHPKIIGATKVGGGIGQPSRIVSPGNASGSNRPPASNSGSSNTGGSAPSPSHIDMPTFQDIHQNDEAVDEHADYDTINRPDEEWHDETYVRRENYKEDKKAEQKEFFQYDATSLVKVDEEIDRYHDINQQLEKIQDNLDEINERKGRAFGQRHLDAINDEKHALQDQLKASQELMEEYQEEAGELTADLLAEGFQIDSEGRIQNYEEGVEAVVSRRNEEQRAILNARNENVARYNQRQQERTDAYNQRSHEITDWTNEGRQQIAQQYDAMVQNEDTIRNNAIQTAYNTRYQEHHTIQDNRANALNALTIEQNQRNQALLASQNEQERAVYEKYYAQIAAHNASIQAQWGDSKNISDDDLRKIVQDNIKAASQAGEDLEAAYKREITDIENATKAAQKALNVEMQEREAAIKADYDEQERLSEERYENAQDQANQRHERQLTIIERQRQEANDIFDIQAENKWRELEDWDELMGEQIDSEYQAQDDILGLEEEASQNRFEKTMSNIERLDNVVSEMGDLANQIQEIKNQIYDSILEGIQYTIELKLRVNDAALKAIQVLIDNVGDSLDKVVDKMALLSRQTRQLGVDANTTFDGIKALIEFRDMETGEVLTDIDSNGIWKKFLNGGLTDSDFKQIKDSDEFTEEQIAALETYRDKLIETLNTIRSVREQEYQLVSDAFDEMINKLDEETNKLEYLTKKAQHYKDVIGIVGRKVLDSTGRLTKQLDQSIFTVAQSTTKANKQTLDTIESNIANLKAQRDQLTDPEEIQRFNDMIAEGEAKRQEAYQKWLDSWKSELEAATTYFQDSIEIIANTFDEKLSGAIGSLDLLSANFDRNRELQDMYVEDYEKIYQLSKLSRDVQNSIDDTEHIKNKAQLKKLMSEINQASEDESKMSQYDLDVLQKKYELEVARLEMEEARNAKSKVRMSRDANGNYGYVYTADENNVAEAEQNYEDKLHEMQVLNTDYIKSLEEQILQTDKDCRDAIANLSMSDFASYEEYEAEVNRIRQHYSSLRDAQLQQMTNATKNNRQLYLEDWTEYSKHTGYKISADENYLDQFNETTYSVLTGFENMTTARQVFQTGLNEMITGALGTYITTSSMYKQALADGDTSIENFGNTVMDTTEDIGTSASTITNDIKTMAQTFQDSFRDMTRELKNFIDEYIKKYKPIIEDMTHLVEGIAGLINYQAFGEASGQGAIVSGVGQNNIDYSVNPAEQQTYTTNTKLAPYIKDVAALLSANIEENTMGWGLAYQAKDKINEVFGQGAYEDIIKYMNKNPQAVQDYWASHWGSDGAFFSSVSYEALRKKYLGFDTGGYTGEWNSNLGRLALLHEKELVLNQNDTENILNTVEMIRDIARTIDINALSASQFMSSMFSAATVADKEQIIQQEVHITAEFPNASDKNEIIDAFDELVNMASQYVNRKV